MGTFGFSQELEMLGNQSGMVNGGVSALMSGGYVGVRHQNVNKNMKKGDRFSHGTLFIILIWWAALLQSLGIFMSEIFV